MPLCVQGLPRGGKTPGLPSSGTSGLGPSGAPPGPIEAWPFSSGHWALHRVEALPLRVGTPKPGLQGGFSSTPSPPWKHYGLLSSGVMFGGHLARFAREHSPFHPQYVLLYWSPLSPPCPLVGIAYVCSAQEAQGRPPDGCRNPGAKFGELIGT